MKTAGILTFHRSINYGSLWQVYALYETLRREGIDAEIIDYEPRIYNKVYGIDPFRKGISLSERFFDIIFYSLLLRRKRAFKRFIDRYLTLSEKKYYFNTPFNELNNKYGHIICGSDQIWNKKASDCDDIYFLPVKHTMKKIAYAVSTGTKNYSGERWNKRTKKLISDFDFISVREGMCKEGLSDYIEHKKEISVALDPTLFLRKRDYEEALHQRIEYKGQKREPYLFLYTIKSPDEIFEFARRVAKKKGLKIRTIATGKRHILKSWLYKDITLSMNRNTPEDFIRYLMEADYVVTDSFHGTAFSINFEKKFFAVNTEADGKLENDMRIEWLLREVGLECRYVASKQLERALSNDTIDYSVIHKKLDLLSEASKKMLLQQITKEN